MPERLEQGVTGDGAQRLRLQLRDMLECPFDLPTGRLYYGRSARIAIAAQRPKTLVITFPVQGLGGTVCITREVPIR